MNFYMPKIDLANISITVCPGDSDHVLNPKVHVGVEGSQKIVLEIKLVKRPDL